MSNRSRTIPRAIPVAAVLLGLLCWVPPARAQEGRRAVDAGFFRPAMDSHGIFVVDRAETGKAWEWGFRFALHGTTDPVNLGFSFIEPGEPTAPVDFAVVFHLGFHVNFTKWLTLGVDVPFSRQGLGAAYDADNVGGFVFNDPLSNTGRNPQKVTAGDPRLGLKFRLFTVKGFSLALAAYATFPFGDEATFNGDRSFTAEPRIIASYSVGRVALAANIGYMWRRANRVYDPAADDDELMLEVDDEMTWGVGAAIRMTRYLGLGIEVYGRGPIHSDMADLPLEALIGLMWKFGRITWAIGGGVGIGSFIKQHDLQPYGRSPAWRIFTGISFVPKEVKKVTVTKDSDGDGIPDNVDQCPGVKEDKDGFDDEDGCPDPDNDQDGIRDEKDKCPNKAEDRDGFQDDDGCPELDNDKDGIPDGRDKCMNQPEDKDGFEDDDGCPDLDNDGDGIPDKQDKCPNEPEDKNGVDDDDGCPEGGAGTGFKGGRIDLKGKRIQFKSGKATLIAVSVKILDRIANLMRNNPQVKLIRIEGHTDDKGRAAANLRLSQQRAVAVLNHLIKRGVSRRRLTAVGYGHRRPKVPNTNAANRAINRRVEFIVVHQTP